MAQLHRAGVVDAAMAILDEYGLGDLTMRRLATALGVAPGALYWHFPNKQTLLGAVADRILEPMDRPVAADEWSAQITELAHRMRDALLAHRDGAEVVSATYASRLTTSKSRERLVAAALRAGMSREEAELTGYTVLHFVLGHTTDEQSRMHMDSAGALPDDAAPMFETPHATARFGFGLQLLLGGVRHLLGSRVR
jgi:AcrR family transcriptional regulator